MDRVVRLADGRMVAVAEHGDPAGDPVFVLHGTPASRVGFDFTDTAARQRQVRIVCPDRPGIGGSDPTHGDRQVAGYARELEALADAMGVEDFSVVGYSGGSPFALAAGAGLGPRVAAIALLAGVGPLGGLGSRATLAWADRVLLELCEHRPRLAGALLTTAAAVARVAPVAALMALRADLPDADRRALERDQRGMALVQTFVEALRQGPCGVIDDYRVQAQPWGFGLGDVDADVDLWHGDADRTVPVTRAEELAAALPRATLHRIAGEGHISVQNHFGAVLDGIKPSDAGS